jgi:hypothetical protein
MWNDIRNKLGIDQLKKSVIMSDVSGSMNGVPMAVSIALGIMISEINDSEFKDRVMTFESQPSWVNLSNCSNLITKVRKLQGAPWGGSTNLDGALQLIIDRMVQTKLQIGEEPEDLIIITDMGFDAACGINSIDSLTILEKFKLAFVKAGKQVWGEDSEGWKCPRIVLWNVRAEYNQFQSSASENGIINLAGWSPNIIKTLKGNAITPIDALRDVLDDPQYQVIRIRLEEMI